VLNFILSDCEFVFISDTVWTFWRIYHRNWWKKYENTEMYIYL